MTEMEIHSDVILKCRLYRRNNNSVDHKRNPFCFLVLFFWFQLRRNDNHHHGHNYRILKLHQVTITYRILEMNVDQNNQSLNPTESPPVCTCLSSSGRVLLATVSPLLDLSSRLRSCTRSLLLNSALLRSETNTPPRCTTCQGSRVNILGHISACGAWF